MGRVSKLEILTILAPHRAQEAVLIEPPYAHQSWYTIKQGIGGLSPQPISLKATCLTNVLDDISILSLVEVGLPKYRLLCLKSKCSWTVKIS